MGTLGLVILGLVLLIGLFPAVRMTEDLLGPMAEALPQPGRNEPQAPSNNRPTTIMKAVFLKKISWICGPRDSISPTCEDQAGASLPVP